MNSLSCPQWILPYLLLYNAEDDDEGEIDEDVDIALAHFVKKGKEKSSKKTWAKTSMVFEKSR